MHIHPRKHSRATVQQLLRHANHCGQSCNLSAQETIGIHASPWRRRSSVVTQASSDHLPLCGPHPVCLCFKLEAWPRSLSITKFDFNNCFRGVLVMKQYKRPINTRPNVQMLWQDKTTDCFLLTCKTGIHWLNKSNETIYKTVKDHICKCNDKTKQQIHSFWVVKKASSDLTTMGASACFVFTNFPPFSFVWIATCARKRGRESEREPARAHARERVELCSLMNVACDTLAWVMSHA